MPDNPLTGIEKENLDFKDPPGLMWIPVQDAVRLLWSENPKLHNIGDLVQSIEKHGFQELPHYDINLPNVSGTLGAIKAGNGRIETLAAMERDSMQLPRGLAQDKKTQAGVMPLLVGTDADSMNAARAYAIDSNNLTMSGGDFTAFDFQRLWNSTQYVKMLKVLGEDGNLPITVSGEGLDSLLFMFLAFYGIVPNVALPMMIVAQASFKILYEVIATPLTYLVVGYVKKQEAKNDEWGTSPVEHIVRSMPLTKE